jgi:gluconolactonase
MIKRAVAFALLGVTAFQAAHAQFADPPERPFSIVRNDPALDELVAPNVKLELLTEGWGLTEGPVWLPPAKGEKEGALLLSDLTANVIYKWTPKEVTVFLDKAGYSGNDFNNAGTQTKRGRVAVLMIGPNGEALDPEGRLVWCASPDGTIVRLEKDGVTRTVLADKYEGKRFNGPNDLAIRSDGAIYFTDSDFGLRGSFKSPQKELSFNGVYLVKDGKTTLAIDDKKLGGFPNGIALSPDEKYLYLTSGFKKIMRYELNKDGTLGEGSVFAEGDEGIVDGMKTDVKGNLYSTGGAGPGAIRVTSADGKYLGMIRLPISHKEPRQQICATNVAFGDADGKSLYITACTALYRIRTKVPGSRLPASR